MESLTAQVEKLREKYFFSLTLSCKLVNSMQGTNQTVNVADLYDTVKHTRLPVDEWPRYITSVLQQSATTTNSDDEVEKERVECRNTNMQMENGRKKRSQCDQHHEQRTAGKKRVRGSAPTEYLSIQDSRPARRRAYH